MCEEIHVKICCRDCLKEVRREGRPNEGYCSRYALLGLKNKSDCPSWGPVRVLHEKSTYCDACWEKLMQAEAAEEASWWNQPG